MISKITPEKIKSTKNADEKAIPFLGGRPGRDICISTDDIVNLIIACNTCSSLEEFFALT